VRGGARYTVSLDAYDVDFNNYVSTITQGGATVYVNSGSVRYRGIETEGHLAVTRFLTDPLSPQNVRLTLSIDNLWDSKAVTDSAGPSSLGPGLVKVLPRRTFMVSLVAQL